MHELKTVGDYIRALREFPEDWPVKVATQAGGGIDIAHREIGGASVVAVFGRNGGIFGENPLTEEEYEKQSSMFLVLRSHGGHEYTSIHGDHRLYRPGGTNATCYGKRFDRRIIERMVAEGLLPANEVDIERVRRCDA
ncbi:MAG: hypothetical protein RL030_1769 [Pseudomonadota bacterium]|jgi:hypothetical protein